MSYGDCDICKNQDTWKCGDCEYNEDREDYFEEMSKEELKKEEAELRAEALKTMPKHNVIVNVSQELLDAFESAKKYSIDDPLRSNLFGVYFDEQDISATNTHVLVVIKRDDIPEELENKMIVELTREMAVISDFSGTSPLEKGNQIGIFPVHTFSQTLTKKKFVDSVRLSNIDPAEANPDKCKFTLGDIDFLFDKKLLEISLSAFAESDEIKFDFSSSFIAITASTATVTVLMLPMRG